MDTIFFIPGHGCTSRVFASQIQALQPHYHCEPIDLLAYQSVQQVEADIIRRAPQKFYILGFSLGAVIAMRVTQQVPTRIKGYIHISAPYEGPPDLLINDVHHAEKILPSMPMQAFAEQAFLNYFPHKKNDRTLHQVFTEMMLETGQKHYLQQANMLLTPWTLDPKAHQHHPVLILGGAIDQRAKPTYHQTMAQQLPTAALHLIEDSGHFVTLEQPVKASELIKAWLTAL